LQPFPFSECRSLVSHEHSQEIEATIPKLSRAEVEKLREWIEDYLEDQLELDDAVTARLDQSRREIAEGHYSTRQP
jgi:mRNA interferase RelE/StbE